MFVIVVAFPVELVVAVLSIDEAEQQTGCGVGAAAVSAAAVGMTNVDTITVNQFMNTRKAHLLKYNLHEGLWRFNSPVEYTFAKVCLSLQRTSPALLE